MLYGNTSQYTSTPPNTVFLGVNVVPMPEDQNIWMEWYQCEVL